MQHSQADDKVSAIGSLNGAVCPPAEWACAWPPPESTPCCSAAGYLGNSSAHCDNGGTNWVDTPCGAHYGPVVDIEVADQNGIVAHTFTSVSVDSTITVFANFFNGASEFPSEIRFTLYDISAPRKADTVANFTCDGDSCVRFHTSCSCPLNVGDSFGHLKINDFTTILGRSGANCAETTTTCAVPPASQATTSSTPDPSTMTTTTTTTTTTTSSIPCIETLDRVVNGHADSTTDGWTPVPASSAPIVVVYDLIRQSSTFQLGGIDSGTPSTLMQFVPVESGAVTATITASLHNSLGDTSTYSGYIQCTIIGTVPAIVPFSNFQTLPPLIPEWTDVTADVQLAPGTIGLLIELKRHGQTSGSDGECIGAYDDNNTALFDNIAVRFCYNPNLASTTPPPHACGSSATDTLTSTATTTATQGDEQLLNSNVSSTTASAGDALAQQQHQQVVITFVFEGDMTQMSTADIAELKDTVTASTIAASNGTITMEDIEFVFVTSGSIHVNVALLDTSNVSISDATTTGDVVARDYLPVATLSSSPSQPLTMTKVIISPSSPSSSTTRATTTSSSLPTSTESVQTNSSSSDGGAISTPNNFTFIGNSTGLSILFLVLLIIALSLVVIAVTVKVVRRKHRSGSANLLPAPSPEFSVDEDHNREQYDPRWSLNSMKQDFQSPVYATISIPPVRTPPVYSTWSAKPKSMSLDRGVSAHARRRLICSPTDSPTLEWDPSS